MTDVDMFESALAEHIRALRHDPGLTTVTWADPMGRLRRARHRRQAKVGGLALAGVTAVAGVASTVHLPRHRDTVGTARTTGEPGSGLDWLLTHDDYLVHNRAHPSPSDFHDMVASPAPVSDELLALKSAVAAAMPAGTLISELDAANGGRRDELHLRATVGTAPVIVERRRLAYPLETSTGTGMTEATWLATGSAIAVAVNSHESYDDWSGPFVWVATADGWLTTWTSPLPVDQLRAWAVAADAHSAG
jgi:hypothetical protein